MEVRVVDVRFGSATSVECRGRKRERGRRFGRGSDANC